jgi:hypothetical protein
LCGYTSNRDRTSATVILARGSAASCPHTGRPSGLDAEIDAKKKDATLSWFNIAGGID